VGAAHDMLTVVAVIVPNKTFVGASGANKVRKIGSKEAKKKLLA